MKKWKTLLFTTVLAVIQVVSSLSCKLSSVTTMLLLSLLVVVVMMMMMMMNNNIIIWIIFSFHAGFCIVLVSLKINFDIFNSIKKLIQQSIGCQNNMPFLQHYNYMYITSHVYSDVHHCIWWPNVCIVTDDRVHYQIFIVWVFL